MTGRLSPTRTWTRRCFLSSQCLSALLIIGCCLTGKEHQNRKMHQNNLNFLHRGSHSEQQWHTDCPGLVFLKLPSPTGINLLPLTSFDICMQPPLTGSVSSVLVLSLQGLQLHCVVCTNGRPSLPGCWPMSGCARPQLADTTTLWIVALRGGIINICQRCHCVPSPVGGGTDWSSLGCLCFPCFD